MLDRRVNGPAELVESVRFLSEHGAYRDALVTASVWAPRYAGQFSAEQQTELNALLGQAEEAADVEVARTNRVELDRTDLQQLEWALEELRLLHDDQIGQHLMTQPILRCQCAVASRYRKARDVTDRLRGDLGLRPRIL
ncbi:MAG TPA: hypothetical protein VGJ60_07525 [Chloroflexota bacterium]|jgi:hypothetical protein